MPYKNKIEKICITLNCDIGDIIEIEKPQTHKVEITDYTTIELFAGAGGLALGVENDWVWKMHGEHCFIIMQSFYRSYSRKYFCLKM